MNDSRSALKNAINTSTILRNLGMPGDSAEASIYSSWRPVTKAKNVGAKTRPAIATWGTQKNMRPASSKAFVDVPAASLDIVLRHKGDELGIEWRHGFFSWGIDGSFHTGMSNGRSLVKGFVQGVVSP
ncbi:hypothetical protein O1611_g276 [Lasiodiplodia mahajangana]|uniref:Uncharacterized protein n=1 Tax=Lasiodiplodia mahajangana TaxID=1108764 RepID=A0ACC2K0Q7_9PEZI|nr:hypothetical protein O1611_g276 [Lasiodiplodia mahajangana]